MYVHAGVRPECCNPARQVETPLFKVRFLAISHISFARVAVEQVSAKRQGVTARKPLLCMQASSQTLRFHQELPP